MMNVITHFSSQIFLSIQEIKILLKYLLVTIITQEDSNYSCTVESTKQTNEEAKKSFHMSKVGLYITGEEAVYPTCSLSHRCCSAGIIHTARHLYILEHYKWLLNDQLFLPGGTEFFCQEKKSHCAVLCPCPKLKQSLPCICHTN